MNRSVLTLWALLACTALVPAKAIGQVVSPPGFGLGITAGAITVSPEEDQREWGASFAGSARYTWPSGLQLVGGVSYGFLDAKEVAGFTVDGKRNVLGVFLDPRLILNVNARTVAPYIGAHIAFLSHSLDTELAGNDLKLSGTGWDFAGMIGVLMRLSDQLAFDVFGTFGLAPFGEADLEVGGEEFKVDGTTTFSASLAVGLVYSFGS